VSLNRVELTGTLTRDPQLEWLPNSGTATMTLAVNGARYNHETRDHEVTTTFVSVLVFGFQAEALHSGKVGRGDEVHVVGALSQREIKKRDGSTEKKTRVEATLVQPVRVKSHLVQPPRTGEHAPDLDEPPF
jgi:single-strand DNA-binding protein